LAQNNKISKKFGGAQMGTQMFTGGGITQTKDFFA